MVSQLGRRQEGNECTAEALPTAAVQGNSRDETPVLHPIPQTAESGKSATNLGQRFGDSNEQQLPMKSNEASQ